MRCAARCVKATRLRCHATRPPSPVRPARLLLVFLLCVDIIVAERGVSYSRFRFSFRAMPVCRATLPRPASQKRGTISPGQLHFSTLPRHRRAAHHATPPVIVYARRVPPIHGSQQQQQRQVKKERAAAINILNVCSRRTLCSFHRLIRYDAHTTFAAITLRLSPPLLPSRHIFAC